MYLKKKGYFSKGTNKKPYFAVILMSVAFFQPGLSQPEIIGGTDVPEGKYPFMAGLVESNDDNLYFGFKCGATLVHPYWVLTAAHCVDVPVSFDVFLGTNSLLSPSEGFERIPIEEIFIHPKFYEFNELDFDIALIKLKHSSQFLPITLANQDDSTLTQPGTICKVIGWGLKDTTSYEHHHLLQEAEIEIIPSSICNDTDAYDGFISTNMLCAGVLEMPLAGAAIGDSGGPLFVWDNGYWLQIGAVMGGQNDWTTIQFPGIYQNLIKHKNWIDSIIQISVVHVNEGTKPPVINFEGNRLVIDNENGINNFQVKIYDCTGKMIGHKKYQPDKTYEIEISHLNLGIYFISLHAGEMIPYTFKIIKIK